jgi:hypothetical protein
VCTTASTPILTSSPIPTLITTSSEATQN